MANKKCKKKCPTRLKKEFKIKRERVPKFPKDDKNNDKTPKRKEALDLLTSNIYLIINLLLVHFVINSQIYNIQFAYKIEDLRKIVMQKYHYKKFYRGR